MGFGFVDREVIISNSVVGLLMFTGLWWVCVNVPEYFNHAVIYMFALLAYILFSVTRVLPSYGFNTDGIRKQLIVGAGASLVVILPFLLMRLTGAIASIAVLSVSPVALFFVVFVAPIVEEMFFRGLMMPVLIDRFDNVYIGIVATAVVFALFHYGVYGVSLNSMMWLIILAVMLGFITVYTGSIIPAIMLHMANNAVSALQFLGYVGFEVYTGLAFAVVTALASFFAYFRVERAYQLALIVGLAGVAISAYTMIEPDYSLNMYGELSALALIATAIPLALLVVADMSKKYGVGITDNLAYATVIATAVLTALVAYYIGASIPVIVLGVLMGVSVAYLLEEI